MYGMPWATTKLLPDFIQLLSLITKVGSAGLRKCCNLVINVTKVFKKKKTLKCLIMFHQEGIVLHKVLGKKTNSCASKSVSVRLEQKTKKEDYVV